MNFIEIIQDPLTSLPISYTGSFRKMLREKFSSFGEMIDKSPFLCGHLNNRPFDAPRFLSRNKALREGILDTIDIYYKGNPSGAYNRLKKTFEETNMNGFMDKQHQLESGTNLFRLRTSDDNYPLSREQLFHIPFELRSRVSTQRYSIPGLPSLYTANSIYVAWEELKRPTFSSIHANRLVNNYTVSLLDLTTDIFTRNEQYMDLDHCGLELLYKLTLWPLIAACSVKVQHPYDPFKPEYIIPQLLLQWINKTNVAGIKYSSTHIDLSQAAHEGTFYNIVFPVLTFDKESGYCHSLTNLFKSTEILPFQLRQFIMQSDRLEHQESISRLVNRDIQTISLIKNTPQPYSSTIFGLVEHNLKGLELDDIKS